MYRNRTAHLGVAAVAEIFTREGSIFIINSLQLASRTSAYEFIYPLYISCFKIASLVLFLYLL